MTIAEEETVPTRRALGPAQFTVAYNMAEGIASILFGVLAGLVSVIGFGFDSGIESPAAILVGLRLAARLRGGQPNERAEKRTLRIVALTFYALAAYAVIVGIHDLSVGERPETSTGSIIVLILSIIVMPALAAVKMRIGRRLGNRLILADAAETRVCTLLSISTLIALIAFSIWGLAWVDPIAGFVIAAFALREGREAWQGELVEDED
ncbi:cation transporter [Gryllotalpicola reticulitermitis]|uniref:Cation transporter n=1 Tax=Gryllotalpicola reticulitermitis TaxID=1184153 RepID=A0ABV8Q6G4_9MICO